VNKRPLLIGSLVLGVAAVVVFWDGEETPDSKGTGVGGKAQSAPGHSAEPSQPKLLPPERRSGDTRTPPSRTGRSTYPDYPRAPGTSYPSARQAQDPMERFSFRPLTDRERKRIEAEYPQRGYPSQADRNHGSPRPADRSREYPSAYDPAPAAPHPGATAPSDYAPYPAQPGYPGWERPGYSFRPLDKAPAARDRWQGPYQDRGWSGEQDYAERWTAPGEPQWGSTAPVQPPSPQRMYPSWDLDTGRRLTSR